MTARAHERFRVTSRGNAIVYEMKGSDSPDDPISNVALHANLTLDYHGSRSICDNFAAAGRLLKPCSHPFNSQSSIKNVQEDLKLLNTVPCAPRGALSLLKEMYALKMPVFLWGKPGIGKSRIVGDFAEQNTMELVDIRLTTLESVDLRGQTAPRENCENS